MEEDNQENKLEEVRRGTVGQFYGTCPCDGCQYSKTCYSDYENCIKEKIQILENRIKEIEKG